MNSANIIFLGNLEGIFMSIGKIKKWITCALLTLISASVYANEDSNCAYIKLTGDAQSTLRISHLNGKLPFDGSNSFNKWERASVIKIPAGNHEFIGAAIPIQVSEGKNKNPPPSQVNAIVPLYFALNVDLGNTYEIKAVKKNKKITDVTVDVFPTTSCDIENEYDASRTVGYSSTKTLKPDKNQLALITRFYQAISKDDDGKSFQSTMPAGFNIELNNEGERVFVPRYQFAVNSVTQTLVRYYPITNTTKNSLDQLILQLTASLKNHSNELRTVEFDLSSTELSSNQLRIDMQTPSEYLANEKSNQVVFRKINRRVDNKTNKWWEGDHDRPIESPIFPSSSRGESLANQTRSSQ